MKTNRSISRVLTVAFGLIGVAATPAPALPLNVPEVANPVVRVANDCYAVGQQVARREGGTLANARATSQGGQQVCVVVVLVPGKSGERPRRAEFVVPNG